MSRNTGWRLEGLGERNGKISRFEAKLEEFTTTCLHNYITYLLVLQAEMVRW